MESVAVRSGSSGNSMRLGGGYIIVTGLKALMEIFMLKCYGMALLNDDSFEDYVDDIFEDSVKLVM